MRESRAMTMMMLVLPWQAEKLGFKLKLKLLRTQKQASKQAAVKLIQIMMEK
jgi:hypothetical protein